jgi:hypothetical protein
LLTAVAKRLVSAVRETDTRALTTRHRSRSNGLVRMPARTASIRLLRKSAGFRRQSTF